jgi:hypothetical protein
MQTVNNRLRRPFALLGAAIVIGLSGCAATGGMTPDEAVQERAQERLERVLAEDYAGAYEYLSPAYRSSVTLAAYQRTMAVRPVRWTGGRIVQSDCSEDVCKVSISLDYAVYGAVPGVSTFQSKSKVEENWIRDDGQWFLVPSE